MFVGFSLSSCFRDIIEGKVKKEEVACIISNTRSHDFQKLYEFYGDAGTRKWTGLDKDKLESLWNEIPVVQPRFRGFSTNKRGFNGGHWLEVEENEV